MKTVTGRVFSAGPISVSKAASILSKFASSDNAATQAVSAYLRRASSAFNELKGLHRDLKASTLKEKKPRSDVTLERNPTRDSDQPGRPDDLTRGGCDGTRKKKHEEEEEDESVGVSDLVGIGEETSRGRVQVSRGPSHDGESERKEGKKKKTKKKDKKNGEEDDGEATTKVEAEDTHRKEETTEKKKKKKKRESDGDMGSEEKKSKKKRKVKELDS